MQAYTSLYTLHGFSWKRPLPLTQLVGDTPIISHILDRINDMHHEERHLSASRLLEGAGLESSFQVVDGLRSRQMTNDSCRGSGTPETSSLGTSAVDLMRAALSLFISIDQARRGLCRQVSRHLFILSMSPIDLTGLSSNPSISIVPDIGMSSERGSAVYQTGRERVISGGKDLEDYEDGDDDEDTKEFRSQRRPQRLTPRHQQHKRLGNEEKNTSSLGRLYVEGHSPEENEDIVPCSSSDTQSTEEAPEGAELRHAAIERDTDPTSSFVQNGHRVSMLRPSQDKSNGENVHDGFGNVNNHLFSIGGSCGLSSAGTINPLVELKSRGVALSVFSPVCLPSLVELYRLVNDDSVLLVADGCWQTIALCSKLLIYSFLWM
ncbi:unnamed protein product [Protopolystoma xenopodis]|uniref:Uncharacterized protein n=1 Tax=Protopolystoma xenopodis TaxID=117903 RepID=A0A448WM91_9PLAT|nr:unnamed protein product [Protopolystoma xenopodis]